MSKVLTSIGVKFVVGASTTWGTKPTTYKKIPQVIENSETDLDPDTIDTTSYDNLKYKSSVPGLIDTTGIQSLTVNATKDEDAETVWNEMVAAHNSGNQIWLCIIIPERANATYIPINPIKPGAPTVVVNDRITITLRYTISGDMEFEAAPNDESIVDPEENA
jgi:hypothetical protein